MMNDPRVAPPPAPDPMALIRDVMRSGMSEADRQRFAQQFMLAERAKRDEKALHVQQQIDRALMDLRREHMEAQRLANEHALDAMKYGSGLHSESVAASAGFMPPTDWKNMQIPNIGNQPFVGFSHAGPENPSVLQERALKQMNPIARDKFEPLFEMMNIQVRYAVSPHWNSSNMWELRRIEPGKPVVTMSWSAPDHDPGCGLATWDAMVSELLDEITRCANNQLPSAAGPTITGQQICGSAGTP